MRSLYVRLEHEMSNCQQQVSFPETRGKFYLSNCLCVPMFWYEKMFSKKQILLRQHSVFSYVTYTCWSLIENLEQPLKYDRFQVYLIVDCRCPILWIEHCQLYACTSASFAQNAQCNFGHFWGFWHISSIFCKMMHCASLCFINEALCIAV